MEWKADPIKLKWASKLSELLIVDVADVFWKFLICNIPREYEKQPDLSLILAQNKELFVHVRDRTKEINHEMFSILYSEDGTDFNPANIELSLLYILIRYLCQIKSPTWKWWFENPRTNQTAPIFNIIRLMRFKEKMNDICNDYKITEEIFNASWNYLSNLLSNLNHKSTVNKFGNHNLDTMRKIVDIMGWQTTGQQERDVVYLNLLRSRKLVIEEASHPFAPFLTFISQFGQKRQQFSPKINRDLCVDFTFKNEYNLDEKNVKFFVNHNYVHDPVAFNGENKAEQDQLSYKKKNCTNKTTVLNDNMMYNKIGHEVYIEGKKKLCECLCEHYIQHNSFICPIPSKPGLKFPINTSYPNLSLLGPDPLNINVEYVKPDDEIISVGNIPALKLGSTELKSWRDALISENSMRIIFTGEHSIGKTTLLRKLSYEWATESTSYLHDYQFVFFVDLELVKKDKPYTSLSDCIIDQCGLIRQNNLKPDEIEDIFKVTDGDNILLLFDNIDQMPYAKCDAMSEISDVICGKKWKKSSVIMTTTNKFLNQKSLFTENLYKNINYLFKRSLFKWQFFSVDGFKTKDVLLSAQGYFDNYLMKNRDLCFRKFKNYLRIFQRDVYTTVTTLPIVTSLLCETWLNSYLDTNKESHENDALSFCDLIQQQFNRIKLDFATTDKNFLQEILDRSLSGNLGEVYIVTPNLDLAESFIKMGILKEVKYLSHPEKTCVRFSNALYEQFTASWILSYQHDLHKVNIDEVIQKHLSSILVVIYLQHFILFCCYQNNRLGDKIIQRLSELVSSDELENEKGGVLGESVINLCIQCFYEMKLITHSAPLVFNSHNNNQAKKKLIKMNFTTDGVLHFSGSYLKLSSVDFLSCNSKEALLSLTTKCNPPLSSSGTVFPYLKVNNFWFKSLLLSSFDGKHVEYVAKLLKNLPFLEMLSLTNVYGVQNKHVAQLCDGLLSMIQKPIPPALHHLEFTTRHSYCQTFNITSYSNLGQCINQLPYLDTLNLTIKNGHLLFSLVEGQLVIPLTQINMPNCGFSSNDCKKLAGVLQNLIFIKTIDLSCNMLSTGFEEMSKQLVLLKRLKKINLSSSCLTAQGIALLSETLRDKCLHNNITDIDLSKNEIQDEKVMHDLCSTLSSMKSLKYLDLSCNLLGDVAVCVLSNGFVKHQHIKQLFLDSVQIGPISLLSLTYNLGECSNLQKLSLAGNYFNEDLLQFASIFKTSKDDGGLRNLKSLNLSGVSDLDPVFVSSKSVLAFIRSITNHNAIQTIVLHHVNMKPRDSVFLFDACEKHKSLNRIVLSKKLVNFSADQSQHWKVLELL